MAQTDPEDGFDQIMVQSWNSVAQQLRTLHNELSGDRARRRERAERAVQNERYEQTRRQQQSIRLEQWEMDNRERLNKGFESTLNATVLADGDGWKEDARLVPLARMDGRRPTGGQLTPATAGRSSRRRPG